MNIGDFVHAVTITDRTGQILFNAIFNSHRFDENATDVDLLAIQMQIHSALDTLHKNMLKVRSGNMPADKNSKANVPSINGYFTGTLSAVDNTRVYGFCTNSQLHFVVCTTESQHITDTRMVELMHSLQNLVVRTTSNPFYIPGMPLMSEKFMQDITKIIAIPTTL